MATNRCWVIAWAVRIDGIRDHRHACDVIALEDSEVCVLPFDKLHRLACDVPSLRRDLFRFISSDIDVQLRDLTCVNGRH